MRISRGRRRDRRGCNHYTRPVYTPDASVSCYDIYVYSIALENLNRTWTINETRNHTFSDFALLSLPQLGNGVIPLDIFLEALKLNAITVAVQVPVHPLETGRNRGRPPLLQKEKEVRTVMMRIREHRGIRGEGPVSGSE